MPWITPIFDRTEQDVRDARAAIAEWLTAPESATVHDLKGALNPSDMNRIEGNMEYLADELTSQGYAVPTMEHRTDWSYADYSDLTPNWEANGLTRILQNLADILDVLPNDLIETEVPDGMLTYEQINDIEEIQEQVYAVIPNLEPTTNITFTLSEPEIDLSEWLDDTRPIVTFTVTVELEPSAKKIINWDVATTEVGNLSGIVNEDTITITPNGDGRTYTVKITGNNQFTPSYGVPSGMLTAVPPWWGFSTKTLSLTATVADGYTQSCPVSIKQLGEVEIDIPEMMPLRPVSTYTIPQITQFAITLSEPVPVQTIITDVIFGAWDGGGRARHTIDLAHDSMYACKITITSHTNLTPYQMVTGASIQVTLPSGQQKKVPFAGFIDIDRQ